MISPLSSEDIDNIVRLVKHVPEWVPGAGFQRFAREGSKMSFAMKMKPYDFVKERIVSTNYSAFGAIYLTDG